MKDRCKNINERCADINDELVCEHQETCEDYEPENEEGKDDESNEVHRK